MILLMVRLQWNVLVVFGDQAGPAVPGADGDYARAILRPQVLGRSCAAALHGRLWQPRREPANCGHSALRLSFPKAAIVPRMATLRGQVSVRIDARRPVGRQCGLVVRRDEGARG